MIMAQSKRILPIKVWLDEESCWNNKPQYSEGYIEYVREDYHVQALLHVLKKGSQFGKKEMLEKAIEWLKEHGKDYWWDVTEQSLEDFRKAMEE